MLGAYNVNGVACELLVEQDALTWWPRTSVQAVAAAPAATGGQTAADASTSPLKHLRRLSSEASSVILSNISQLSGSGSLEASDTRGEKAPPISDTKNKRRIEFSQIVGLRRVACGAGKSAPAPKVSRQGLDRSDSNSTATISDESSQASGFREEPSSGDQQTRARADHLFCKFKLYYVKRNENKSSGRLMKLKKISVGPVDAAVTRKQTNKPGHQEQQHESPGCEGSRSQDSLAGNRNSDCTSSALVGLYEQVEQYLELVRRHRPKRLLVFVNPYGGKGRALHLFKSKVRKVLELAQVECELVVTKHANHARETIEDPTYPLDRFDGIVCIGGDGMFGELMNGLLFRCNRDKLLASEVSSINKRLSDSLSCSSETTSTTETHPTNTHARSSSGATDLSARTGLVSDTSAGERHRHLLRDHQHQQHHNHDDQRQNHHTQNHDTNHNNSSHHDTGHSLSTSTTNSSSGDSQSTTDDLGQAAAEATAAVAASRAATEQKCALDSEKRREQLRQQLKFLRSSLGGIGKQFATPSIPVGVIGAGSTDANLFGFIGTNDAVSATLNIVLGNQIQIDVCSIHSIQDDRLLRFVSTFVAYGYFGDVIRESEKLRWLGPSRYDVTALNSLIKYRHYQGLVRILRSSRDGTPLDLNRCHLNCRLCGPRGQLSEDGHLDLTPEGVNENNNNNNNGSNNSNNKVKMPLSFSFDEAALARLRACDEAGSGYEKQAASIGAQADARGQSPALLDDCDQFEILEEPGPFMGVNAAVTACRCPQTRKGFSPGNHLANGCADLILVRPCSRLQYINYLIRTGYTKKSAFDLKYVDAHRCRQFEFIAQPSDPADGDMGGGENGHHEQRRTRSSWNADGEILREESLRVKVNNRLLRVFGTGEPQRRARASGAKRKQRA